MVSGDVSGTSRVGGVVGINDGIVKGCCFSDGSVAGTNYVGGVVGNNIGGTVEGCCFAGDNVSGSENANVGGVVGDSSGGKVTACYWQTGTGGTPSGGVGGYPGDTHTIEVKDGDWTEAIDAMNEALKQAGCDDISYEPGADGKPVLVANSSNTTELPGLTQRVLDVARVFGL